MYEAFFSLEDSPFVLTPDPRFLLRSKGHHEILSSLLYGITSQKGLMALIGDVGTGKTTLCRALLRELPADVQSALVLNPHLSDVELVGTILDDLGIDRRGATKGELMTTLNQHLLATGEEGKTVVVVLDEAQQMSVEALEQIRILSTLETATRKLLQIVLVGQPELEDKLRRRELRQLEQRIGIRCYLTPLSKKDTFRYVEHRLRIAGLLGAVPFSRAALARVYHRSGGVPRVINLLCDRALMAAFSARAREVTPALVRTAARNLEGRGGARRRRALAPEWPILRRLAMAAGITGLAVLAGAAAAAFVADRTLPVAALSPPAGVAMLSPPAADVSRVDAAGSASSAPPVVPVAVGAPPPPVNLDARPTEPVRSILAQLLRLWGVAEDLSPATVAAWPTTAGGALDIAAVATRYHLAATFLSDASLAELRAVGLPALVGLEERGTRQPYLLRRLDRDSATLTSATGEERRLALDGLLPTWTHSAWVVWRNVDLLPADPAAELTPTVVATVALRLSKLGFFSGAPPPAADKRLEQAIRRFQRAAGLPEDGVIGPRTTLALARATAGPFGPTLTAASPPR
jgi:general secretion pathway protein A